MWVIFMLKLNLTNVGKKYLVAAVVSLLVYLAMKYISPIASPFILAFLVAGTLNPLVQALHKRIKIRKPVLAGIILFSASVLIIVLIWALMAALFANGGKIAGELPDYQEEFGNLLGDCCNMMERQFGVDGVQIEKFVLEQVNIFIENLEVKVLPAIMGKSMDYARNIVSFVSFFFVGPFEKKLPFLAPLNLYFSRALSRRFHPGFFPVHGRCLGRDLKWDCSRPVRSY